MAEPTTQKTYPPLAADEVTMLRAFLDYYRATVRRQAEGLSRDELARTLPPTTMTLGGLLKHLALVEESWLVERMDGGELGEPWASADWDADGDWEWHSAEGDEPAALFALYDHSLALADAAIDRGLAKDGLDTASVAVSTRTGQPTTLRWIMVHLIEEYARHAGHADLIRESIDGATDL